MDHPAAGFHDGLGAIKVSALNDRVICAHDIVRGAGPHVPDNYVRDGEEERGMKLTEHISEGDTTARSEPYRPGSQLFPSPRMPGWIPL